MGRARDDLAPGLRSLVVQSKYLIFYRVLDKKVQVMRILHGARDIDRSYFEDVD
jgi:toxin ParE1/3/4